MPPVSQCVSRVYTALELLGGCGLKSELAELAGCSRPWFHVHGRLYMDVHRFGRFTIYCMPGAPVTNHPLVKAAAEAAEEYCGRWVWAVELYREIWRRAYRRREMPHVYVRMIHHILRALGYIYDSAEECLHVEGVGEVCVSSNGQARRNNKTRYKIVCHG